MGFDIASPAKLFSINDDELSTDDSRWESIAKDFSGFFDRDGHEMAMAHSSGPNLDCLHLVRLQLAYLTV